VTADRPPAWRRFVGSNTEAPYWRRHDGIDRPWTPTPAGRMGCVVMMIGFVVLIAVVLVIALIAGTF
jgi:hypothetical protein